MCGWIIWERKQLKRIWVWRAGEPIVGLSIHRDDAERLCHREHPPLSLPAIVMPTLNAAFL